MVRRRPDHLTSLPVIERCGRGVAPADQSTEKAAMSRPALPVERPVTAPAGLRPRRYLPRLRLLGGAVYALLWAAAELGMLVLAVIYFQVDFDVLWGAGSAVASGQNPYVGVTDGTLAELRGYVYPPLFALMLAPFTLVLDAATARWAWLASGLLCAAGSARLILRLVPLRIPEDRGLVLLVALPLAPVLTWALGVGQPSPELLLLVTAAYAALRARRGAVAGALLAVGASLKLFPAVLGGYLLLRREWTAAASALAVGLGLLAATSLLLGINLYWSWLAVLSRAQGDHSWVGEPLHLSLAAFFTRLFTARTTTTPIVAWDALAQLLIVSSSLGVLAAAGYAIWRARGREDVAYALAVVTMLLITPVSGQYNLVIAALPLAVAAARVRDDWPRQAGWLVTICVLLTLPADYCHLWPVAYWCVNVWDLPFSLLPWRVGVGLLLDSGMLYGLVALWLLLLRQCLDPPPEPIAEPPPV